MAEHRPPAHTACIPAFLYRSSRDIGSCYGVRRRRRFIGASWRHAITVARPCAIACPRPVTRTRTSTRTTTSTSTATQRRPRRLFNDF